MEVTMTTIAIISDTHGLLRPEVCEHLKQVGYILHAGDIHTKEIYDELLTYAPLFVVRGNNDKEWAEFLPSSLTISVDSITFYLIHNKNEIKQLPTEVNIVVYGHSHKYSLERKEDVLWLNPGSCGRKRFHQDVTMAILIVEDDRYRIYKINFNASYS